MKRARSHKIQWDGAPGVVGFVYMWTNLDSGRKYIGSHLGSPDDGYAGSGKLFVRAWNKSTPDCWKREVLHVEYDNPQNVRLVENRIILEHDAVAREDYYNLTVTYDDPITRPPLTEKLRRIEQRRINMFGAKFYREMSESIVAAGIAHDQSSIGTVFSFGGMDYVLKRKNRHVAMLTSAADPESEPVYVSWRQLGDMSPVGFIPTPRRKRPTMAGMVAR